MSPIQRITRYPLLLSEISALYNKAKVASEAEGIQLTENQKKNMFYIQEALSLSFDLATYVNNMMDAGRVMEYPVKFLLVIKDYYCWCLHLSFNSCKVMILCTYYLFSSRAVLPKMDCYRTSQMSFAIRGSLEFLSSENNKKQKNVRYSFLIKL